MKKYTISLFVALFALVGLASAQTVALTGGYEGQYVFRGQKISDNIASGTVTVSLPSNTELSVVAYQNTRNKDVSVNNEFDVTLSQGYSVDEVTTVTVGGTGYFYPAASTSAGETRYTFEAFSSLSYEAFLSPTVTAGYDFRLKQIFVEGSLSQDVKLPFLATNWKLVPSVAAGWAGARNLLPEQAGKAVKDSYYYVTPQVNLVYEIKHVELSVGYRYNYLFNSANSHNSWVGGAVTVKF